MLCIDKKRSESSLYYWEKNSISFRKTKKSTIQTKFLSIQYENINYKYSLPGILVAVSPVPLLPTLTRHKDLSEIDNKYNKYNKLKRRWL